jgi:signal transduction histidine kinase
VATLAFVVVLTAVALQFVSVYWAVVDCETDSVKQWLIAGGTLVPAVLRRFLPAVALLSAAALFGCYPATAAAFALTAYSAASRIGSGRRLALVATMAGVLPLGIAVVGSQFQWKSVLAAFGFGVVVCVVVPTMLGLVLGQRERLLVALRQQTGYLRRTSELADSAARLQERTRIAGEMHDLLGHRLSLISLYAGALELDAAKGSDEAKLIRYTVANAMDELRGVLGVLREAGHDERATHPAGSIGLRCDIVELVAQSRAAGIPVDLAWHGSDLHGVAPAIRRAVHRIVREALTNVHRHAPGSAARVEVERTAERVRVGVSNAAGPGGGHPAGSGSGLVGAQERVRLLGGTLSAGPAPGGGFDVRAELPFDATAAPSPSVPANAAATGDGGPVRRGDRWARAGMSAVLSTGLVGAIAIVNLAFGYVLFEPSAQAGAEPAVKLGMSRQEVTDLVGDDPLVRLAAQGAEPDRAPDLQCLYGFDGYGYGLEDVTPGPWRVWRYCFRQDRLVEVVHFDLPDPGN